MFQDFRYSDTTHLSRSVEVLKLKKFQERCNIKAFQEWYEHVGPEVASPQDGKVTRWRRDCAWLMISRCSRSQCQIQVQGTSSIQEVNDHYNIFTRESQEYELKTKDKANGSNKDKGICVKLIQLKPFKQHCYIKAIYIILQASQQKSIALVSQHREAKGFFGKKIKLADSRGTP
ncbi:hypothetical protein Tco_1407333 [Tanacetum coccineum]